MFGFVPRTFVAGNSNAFAEMQSVYSTAQSKMASEIQNLKFKLYCRQVNSYTISLVSTMKCSLYESTPYIKIERFNWKRKIILVPTHVQMSAYETKMFLDSKQNLG